MKLPVNKFKKALREGRQQIGFWASIPSPMVVEMLGGAGFDWLLLDTEHTPSDPLTIYSLLQAMNGSGTSAVVRPDWNDTVLFKRYLDIGVQSFLVPFVQNAEEAAAAVAATRYPPEGRRGVSTVSCATHYGRVENYVRSAAKEICVTVQVETVQALSQIEAIAAVDGVDGIFIGPADLATSMGHAGATRHPEVMQTIEDAVGRIRKAGKPAGFLTPDRDYARKAIEWGCRFTAVGIDAELLVRNVDALAAEFAGT